MTALNKAGCVLCAAMAFVCTAAWGGENLIVNGTPQGRPLVRFGMVTDLHYAALRRVGRRHYRDSLRKLGEAVDLFNARTPNGGRTMDKGWYSFVCGGVR